jgi:hypothetical protein
MGKDRGDGSGELPRLEQGASAARIAHGPLYRLAVYIDGPCTSHWGFELSICGDHTRLTQFPLSDIWCRTPASGLGLIVLSVAFDKVCIRFLCFTTSSLSGTHANDEIDL